VETLLFGEVTDFRSLKRGSPRWGNDFGSFRNQTRAVRRSPYVGAVILAPPEPQDRTSTLWSEDAIARDPVIHLSLMKLMPTKDPTKIDFNARGNYELGAIYQSNTQQVMAAVGNRRPLYAWKLIYPRGDNYDELA